MARYEVIGTVSDPGEFCPASGDDHYARHTHEGAAALLAEDLVKHRLLRRAFSAAWFAAGARRDKPDARLASGSPGRGGVAWPPRR